MMTPVAISLFTGAGGLDHGFEAAGFSTAVGVELDSRCVETLRANWFWPVIDRDIAAVTTAELLALASLSVGEADVLIGGPPCQPFSKAGFWVTGEARRLNDPRASTLDHYLRILAEARPRAFLLENVEGLGFRGKDEGLRLIQEALAVINEQFGTRYSATVGVLNAADYGVPQLRRRLFVVGARDGTRFRFPEPTHASPAAIGRRGDNRQRWLTAWDALHDVTEPRDPGLAMQGKWAGLMASIPEGQNYLWHTDRGGGEPLFGWRRRFWSFLLKLAKDQPAWTLAAQPGPATGPFHWSGRRLSRREMARLQTFPDHAILTGSLADVQRQLGNAVPSLLAEVLARAIAKQLLGLPDVGEEPRLSIRPASTRPPPPAPVAAVPSPYLNLRGQHNAHPGTGKGYAAVARKGFSGRLVTQESGQSIAKACEVPQLAFPNDEHAPAESF
jgi:DNA (cytosine-5)-methyltransferase 1